MNYILFLIILTSIVLILPYKKMNLIKKILCSATVAFAIALVGQSIYIDRANFVNSDSVTITATGEKNEESQGTEVWIKGVIIDGKSYKADKIFDNKWISKDDGVLAWREFDQPSNFSNSIEGKLPSGEKRSIVFDSNKWRGKAKVDIDGKTIDVDLFTKQENSKDISIELPYIQPNNAERTPNNGANTIVFVVMFLITFMVSMMLYFIEDRKEGIIQDDKTNDYNKREIWADLLRIVSAFTVVYLHTTCSIYSQFTNNMQIWYSYLYINSFTAFAVPCFFMLSGAFVIKKELNLKKLLTKQIFNLIIPLFFWSIVYLALRKFYSHEDMSFIKSIFNIPFTSQYSHLWFMYPLIGFYLLAPFISYIYYNANKNLKLYGIISTGFIPAIISTISVWLGKSIDMPWFAIGFPELGLFLVGKYIYENKQKLFGKQRLCAVGIFIGYSLTVLGSYYISIKRGMPQKDFFQYSRIPVIILSISIFMFFVAIEPCLQKTKQSIRKVISKLASLSMGIYFSHLLVKQFLGNKIWLFTDNSGSNVTMLLGAILYFCFSAMICLILSNIPYINTAVISGSRRKSK